MTRVHEDVTSDLSPDDVAQVLSSQTEVLQMLAAGAPLESTLSTILLSLEELLPGSRCSVLLHRPETSTLHHGAAPTLPATYSSSIDGMSTGPSAGSCGTAVFERQPVIVEDIATDARWAQFRALALAHGLAACWSSPIEGRDGITGTFAVYRGEPATPNRRERALVRQYTHIASVAIDQSRLLEAEVARRAAELANRNKSEFVAGLSHEIRTPLQTIIGMTEMLRSVDMPNDRRQLALDLMARAGQHVTELVNDVLDLARIEAGSLPIRLEDIAVRPLLEEMRDLLRPMSASRDITVEVGPCDVVVRADGRRLRQVLINLVTNAVIHNVPAGSARLSARADGDGVVIVIEDSGPGIDPDRLDRIFIPFDRLGADDAGTTGSGLGMALSLALVRGMGGRLTVTSTPSEGTTVEVSLPQAHGAESGEASDSGAEGWPELTEDALDDVAGGMP